LIREVPYRQFLSIGVFIRGGESVELKFRVHHVKRGKRSWGESGIN
jgi:hypothetical protein